MPKKERREVGVGSGLATVAGLTMKILQLGNCYFGGAFREMGHEVKWASTDPGADVVLSPFLVEAKNLLAALPADWRPDVIVMGDHSGFPKILGLEALSIPLAWYAVDSHIHHDWHRHYSAVWDFVFVAQKEWAPLYALEPDRQTVSWMPLFCHAAHDRDLNRARTAPLVFVGTLNPAWNPDRVELMQRLQARYPIDVRTGAYVEIFNQAQMVLNQSVAGDVNFRTFQAMACGAMLVTERVGNGFEELFQDRVHCAVYEKGNVEQIVEIARYYENHPSEREAIAACGRQAVLARHTSHHRAEALLSLIARSDVSAMVSKRLARQAAIQGSMAQVYDVAMRSYLKAANRGEGERKTVFYNTIARQYAEQGLAICRRLGPMAQAASCPAA
ncbi:MAG: glycosyltransferase [Nitrospira sp.]|nr:glycosyltransferase [Nitrospira sp.]